MTGYAPEFVDMGKTPRLFRDIIITEKIDGTNAGIHVSPDGQVAAQSRNRIITPDSDNYGFARWVADNADELAHILGPGLHFGEWWGQGIQRRYGLTERPVGDESHVVDRRFSLFNVDRWHKAGPDGESMHSRAEQSSLCGVVDVVPVLYRGTFREEMIVFVMAELRRAGSFAVPGFMNPEGICVYHSQSRTVYKVTLDNHDRGKWEAAA
ncbi:RNA ligase family protein [Kitasatospora sp. NPDC086009]|uniref:RNA ligase family protein n=1 Tax=unclassified Kitasatospora TaxID=2633591 RepID=UPI0037C6F564